jgi:hypothetical protein
VADGTITADGRSLTWKCRDFTWSANRLVRYPAGGDSDSNGVADRYDYVAVVDPNAMGGNHRPGEEVRQGLNVAGLSSCQNALVGNWGWPNAHFLAQCAGLDEVRADIRCNRITRGSIYFFSDASNRVSVFEIDAADRFRTYEYDPTAPGRATQFIRTVRGPVNRSGFVVRFNERGHFNGDGLDDVGAPASGETASGSELIAMNKAMGNFTVKTLWQGLRGAEGVNDWHGFVRRNIGAVAATAIHGVKPGEDPRLATMWTALGDTRFSVAVPVWAMVSNLPPSMASSAADGFAEVVGGEGSAGGLYHRFGVTNRTYVARRTMPMESKYFDTVLNKLLPQWRVRDWSDPAVVARTMAEMTRVENQMAADAYRLLERMLNGRSDNYAPMASGIDGYKVIRRTVRFSCTVADRDGSITNQFWNYGDGQTGSASSHTYDAAGTYLASFTVTDNDGVRYTDWMFVEVRPDPVP